MLSFIRVRHKPDAPWDVVRGSEGCASSVLPHWADAYPASQWEWVPGYVFTESDHDAWLRLEDELGRAIEAPEAFAILRG